jgi:hypothetical protein
MNYCSRDLNPPELLEEVGNSADDWMLQEGGDVQKRSKGGGENYVVWVCVCVCMCVCV